MTWRDNLRGASSEDGFIIANGSGGGLIPQNTNWHDNYMNSFTENGIKIANLKDAVTQVSELPGTGDEGVLYYLTGPNPGMYYYEGNDWVLVGDGGVSDFNDLTNRPKLNDSAMTGNTNITNFTGTDGTAAGAQGLVPAPAAADADKFLKSDGTWATAGGGGGDTVYSSKSTSISATGGAVYIGNLDSNQTEQVDPTNANNSKYFIALPYNNTTQGRTGMINILGAATGVQSITIGMNATTGWQEGIAIGPSAHAYDQGSIAIGPYCAATGGNDVAIGRFAQTNVYGVYVGYSDGSDHSAHGNNSVCLGAVSSVPYAYPFSVALGANAEPTRAGEVNVGLVTGNTTSGYNSTAYRVIGGVYDGQNAHDAVTLGQLNALITELQALGLNVSLQGAANNANQNSGSSEDPGMVEPDPGVAEPTVTCPFCGEQTSAVSTICQFCGNDISGGAVPDPGEEPGPEIPPEEPTEEPVEG